MFSKMYVVYINKLVLVLVLTLVNNEELKAIVEADATQSTAELAAAFDVSIKTILVHLRQISKVKKLDRWLPHELYDSQRNVRVETCFALLNRHRNEGILKRIVTCDKKWILFDNRKRSASWLDPGSAPKQCPKQKITPREGRTPEDMRKIIKTAKLHESELSEISQVLRFPDATKQNDNLRLVLLDSYLLKEIEDGNELQFKGDPDDNVVLCTSNRTYNVKEAETSNSLLLVPDLLFAASTGLDETVTNVSMESDTDTSFDKSNSSLNKSTESDDGAKPPRIIEFKDILNTFFTYYEVKPCKPRFSKLKKLLDLAKYKGAELEYALDKSKLVTYETLLDQVQASRVELDKELENIQAICIDGHFRLLEFDYEFRVLSYMLDLIEENSWPHNRVSKELTLDSLKELVPLPILEAVFRFYTTESICLEGTQYYQYKQDKVCRFLARVLLKSAGKFNLTEFLQAWSDSVPEGMITDENMLCGIALIDKMSTPKVIWGFAESDLPDDINERFKILFQAKDKWTIQEISPYIECYASEKLNVNALLTKYARASTQDGVRVFSAKHMK